MARRYGLRPSRPMSSIIRSEGAQKKARHTLIHSRPLLRRLPPLAHDSVGAVAQFYFGADKQSSMGTIRMPSERRVPTPADAAAQPHRRTAATSLAAKLTACLRWPPQAAAIVKMCSPRAYDDSSPHASASWMEAPSLRRYQQARELDVFVRHPASPPVVSHNVPHD